MKLDVDTWNRVSGSWQALFPWVLAGVEESMGCNYCMSQGCMLFQVLGSAITQACSSVSSVQG